MEVHIILTGRNQETSVIGVYRGSVIKVQELCMYFKNKDKKLNINDSWYEIYTLEIENINLMKIEEEV